MKGIYTYFSLEIIYDNLSIIMICYFSTIQTSEVGSILGRHEMYSQKWLILLTKFQFGCMI